MIEFSSDEMRRLQDEAKKRVLDMKNRSRFLTEDMNRDISENDGDDSRFIRHGKTARSIKMPVELVQTAQKVSESSLREKRQDTPAEHKEKRKPEKSSALFGDLFSRLSDDELERLFILSLCLLLSHEQSDGEVVLALMYILS